MNQEMETWGYMRKRVADFWTQYGFGTTNTSPLSKGKCLSSPYSVSTLSSHAGPLTQASNPLFSEATRDYSPDGRDWNWDGAAFDVRKLFQRPEGSDFQIVEDGKLTSCLGRCSRNTVHCEPCNMGLPFPKRLRFANPVRPRIGALTSVDSAASVSEAAITGFGLLANFEFIPVIDLEERERVLYWECVARTPISGLEPSALHIIDRLEHAQHSVHFDELLIHHILDLLTVHQAKRIGFTLSAKSVALTDSLMPMWTRILDRLTQDTELGVRLVLEIAEDARLLPDVSRRLVNRLQGLGVKIAIDHYGLTYGVETGIAICAPDFIKIDKTMLDAARLSDKGATRLRRTTALARALAPVVLVEGIESAADLQLAIGVGVRGGQGKYLRRFDKF